MQFQNFSNFASGLLLFSSFSVSSNDINLFGFLVFGRRTKVDATKWRLAGEIVACICIFSASAWPAKERVRDILFGKVQAHLAPSCFPKIFPFSRP